MAPSSPRVRLVSAPHVSAPDFLSLRVHFLLCLFAMCPAVCFHCSSVIFLIFSVAFFVLPHFPIVSSRDANAKLKHCCSTLLSETDDQECVARFCDFEAISQANVLNFLSKCKDKGDTVGHMWDCASSRIDHSACCKDKGVSDKCMEYCTAQDGVPQNYWEYANCVDYFDYIRDCFKDHLEKKKEN